METVEIVVQQPQKFDPQQHYTLLELCADQLDPEVAKTSYNHPDRTLQVMDFYTADTLLRSAEQKGLVERIPVYEFFPDYVPPTVQDTNLYIADRQWYADAKHEQSIHGKMHATRVLLNITILGQMMGLPETEMEALKVAAMVHDLQRVFDTPDLKHATEGARWLRDNSYLLEKRGIHLTEAQIDIAEAMIKYHMEEDFKKVPKKYHTLLRVFQAADGADLYRTANEKWWPTPSRFDTLFGEIVARNTSVNRKDRKTVVIELRDKFLKMNAYMALTSQHITTRYQDQGYMLDGLYAIQAVTSELGTLEYDPEEILASPPSDTTSVATLVQEKSPQNFDEFQNAILEALQQVKDAHPEKEIWLVSGAVRGKSEDSLEKQNKDRYENEQRLKSITAQLQKEHPERIYFTSGQIMSPRIRRLLTDGVPKAISDEAFVSTWKNVVTIAGNSNQRTLHGITSVEGWDRSQGARAEREAAVIQDISIEEFLLSQKVTLSPTRRYEWLKYFQRNTRRLVSLPTGFF